MMARYSSHDFNAITLYGVPDLDVFLELMPGIESDRRSPLLEIGSSDPT